MNAIIGLQNVALRDPELTPATRDNLQKIGTSANHLLGLINDILDMSRIESGRMVLKKEEFSFRDFLDQINGIINAQCQDKRLNYKYKIANSVKDYYVGDVLKLKQIVIIILGNSVKFTNPRGDVILKVEQLSETDGICRVRFVMEDTGIGMDPGIIAMTANVFDEDVEKSKEAGMDAHLSKPVEPDKLYETMARLISERAAEGGSECIKINT